MTLPNTRLGYLNTEQNLRNLSSRVGTDSARRALRDQEKGTLGSNSFRLPPSGQYCDKIFKTITQPKQWLTHYDHICDWWSTTTEDDNYPSKDQNKFSPFLLSPTLLFLHVFLGVLDIVHTFHVLKRLKCWGDKWKVQKPKLIPTCEGYQNAEKQVGQLRLSSSSSSSSPNPEDDEKMEVVEEDVEDDKFFGTFPVLAIVFSICFPWAEFTFITAFGFIFANFFFWAIFIFVFCVIFSETISMSSSSSNRFFAPLDGGCFGVSGFLTDVVTWMLYFSNFSWKQKPLVKVSPQIERQTNKREDKSLLKAWICYKL